MDLGEAFTPGVYSPGFRAWFTDWVYWVDFAQAFHIERSDKMRQPACTRSNNTSTPSPSKPSHFPIPSTPSPSKPRHHHPVLTISALSSPSSPLTSTYICSALIPSPPHHLTLKTCVQSVWVVCVVMLMRIFILNVCIARPCPRRSLLPMARWTFVA